MRLFVAVEISDETRGQLRRVRETLQPLLTGARRSPRITWVADDAAHITIRFIGEVSDAIGDQVRSVMTDPIAIAPFDVEFGGVGAFPGGRSPRVVWIGITTGQDELARVAQMVNARVDPIAGAGESRPFRAHLTVGRVKDPGAGFAWRQRLRSIDSGTTRSRVDRVTLFQSRTEPKGPSYTSLLVAPLGVQSSKFKVQSSKLKVESEK